MDTISKDKAITLLHQKRVSLFTVADAHKIFNISRENTLYKLLQRLENNGIVKRVKHGKYLFTLREANEFTIANFLVNPSYISLESALSFHGILSQFPYTITSITPMKSQKIICQDKEYEYVHIDKKYFFGFMNNGKFITATPEKALIDTLYLVAKKLRSIHFEELNLEPINKEKFKLLSNGYSLTPLAKLLKKLSLC